MWEVGKKTAMFRLARESLIAQYYSGGAHKAFLSQRHSSLLRTLQPMNLDLFRFFLKCIGLVIYAAVGTLVTIIGRKQRRNIQALK